MFQIKTSTVEDHRALIFLVFKLGYSFSNGSNTLEEYDARYGPFKYPYVLIYDNKKDVGGNCEYNANCGDELVYPQDITEIFNRLFDIEKGIVFHIFDVGDYEAMVSSKGIQVGCQTISLEKFAELAKAVASIKGN